MMEHFWRAVTDACLADNGLTGLKILTQDQRTTAPFDMRIGRTRPTKTSKYPFLGLLEVGNDSGISDSPSHYKRVIVGFECSGKLELDAMRIADRIETLVHRDGQNQDKYWDISNTQVLNHATLFVDRRPSEYDTSIDAWVALVSVDFRWNLKVPPTI